MSKTLLGRGVLTWNFLYLFTFPSTYILRCEISLPMVSLSMKTDEIPVSSITVSPTGSVSSGPRTLSLSKLFLLQLKQGEKKRFGCKTSIKHCSTLQLSMNHQRTNKYLPLFVLVLFTCYQHRAEDISKALSYWLCVFVCARTKKHESAQLSGSATRFTLPSCRRFFQASPNP